MPLLPKSTNGKHRVPVEDVALSVISEGIATSPGVHVRALSDERTCDERRTYVHWRMNVRALADERTCNNLCFMLD